MNQKQENPIRILFRFAGEAKGKMPLSILLAVLGELCGMLPFLAAAMLANEVYAGTATVQSAFRWAGGAALGIVLRTLSHQGRNRCSSSGTSNVSPRQGKLGISSGPQSGHEQVQREMCLGGKVGHSPKKSQIKCNPYKISRMPSPESKQSN